MTAKLPFTSSIPRGARGRVVRRHPSGAKERVDYRHAGMIVGYRLFDPEGALLFDCGLRGDRPHGMAYRLDTPGRVLSATPYRNGLEHGVAKQWSADGKRLIGSYGMRNGTGLDLWWQESWAHPPTVYLAEARFVVAGQLHGFEWWLNEDQASVHEERNWRKGRLHGIERVWDGKGKLRRGYPRYFIQGDRVTREAYERARKTDRSLPPVRKAEDRNRRTFPSAVARRLAFRHGRGVAVHANRTKSTG
jgi:antitoxin component YwqK of YwqJK toxin-antitoxin module